MLDRFDEHVFIFTRLLGRLFLVFTWLEILPSMYLAIDLNYPIYSSFAFSENSLHKQI